MNNKIKINKGIRSKIIWKLNELRKEIVSNGGEIIDKESFKYNGIIHYIFLWIIIMIQYY